MNIFFRLAAQPKADAAVLRRMKRESLVECAGQFEVSAKVIHSKRMPSKFNLHLQELAHTAGDFNSRKQCIYPARERACGTIFSLQQPIRESERQRSRRCC